jgi:hypothetical protein
MGKKLVKNYVFNPGISVESNLFPNAYASIQANKTYIAAELEGYLNSRIAIDTAANLYPKAVALLTANKSFIQNEMVAYINYQVSSGALAYIGYTYDSTKCISDSSYVLDAVLRDLRYGGNEKIKYIAGYYYINGVKQVRNIAEADVYTFAITLINNYVFTNTLFTARQSIAAQVQITGQAAESGAAARITSEFNTLITALNSGLAAMPATVNATYPFAGYSYNTAKCERDLGYVLDAYLYDLRYGGNTKIRYVVGFYYFGNALQVDGSGQPEIVGHAFVRDLINNYIIRNIANPSPYQFTIAQNINTGRTFEVGADTRITSEAQALLDTISGGPTAIPAEVSPSVGSVKLQGKWDLSDILLMTNVTANTIIYNFAASTVGGEVDQNDASTNFKFVEKTDQDFPKFLQTTDGVTSIFLNVNTSSMSSTDEIQVFVEDKQMAVRPYDFGTDAIERMRVAAPQSMLDADFEYGLQPTKWAAISVQRGYPSIYEVPGTDATTVSIVTDASAGTNNIGGSLITVTTVSPHGFSVGQPITIKGLNPAVTGFSRAEGSFVVNTVPSNVQFTYFAKAKVGTVNPTSLLTTNVQLRTGGFYTGADIGSPTISVFSNGGSGTITAALNTRSGSSAIAFTGTAPSFGAPLTATGIPTGAQVTSVIGTGGVIVTPLLTQDISSGSLTATVNDTTGIQTGISVNDGAGNATQVIGINGNELTFSNSFGANIAGNTVTYNGLTGVDVVGTGSSATFTVTDTGGTYSVSLGAAGSGYDVGDTILVLGTDLGGASPANDAYITVDAVSTGAITSASVTGVGFNGQTITNAVYTTTTTTGSGAQFQVDRADTFYAVTISDGGVDYTVGDTFTILGTEFRGGSTTANDLNISVAQVTKTYTAVGQDSTTGGGSAASFDVTRLGASYPTVIINSPGAGFNTGDTVTILGSNLGGVDVTNDLVITVLGVNGSNQITNFTYTGVADGTGTITQVFNTGTASNIAPFSGVTGTNSASPGVGLVVSVIRSSATYGSLVIQNGGNSYSVGNKVSILGTNIGGATPTNDMVVQITAVDVNGAATDGTILSGTAAAGAVFSFYSTLTISDPVTSTVASTTSIAYASLATLQITFQNPHGIVPGNNFIVAVTSDNGSNNHTLASGSFVATQIPTLTTLRYQARSTGVISVAGNQIIGKVYARPDSFFTHRPYDGGVQLGTGGPSHGAQAIRQSKKYIRYQSGKGIMYTTGALFAPGYDLQSLTSTGLEVGSTITITTDENDHGLQIGGVIRIDGVISGGYDGDYVVQKVISERVFQVLSQYRLETKTAILGDGCKVLVVNWEGAKVRAGTFDDQNGIFWEYDGHQLYAVQRTSTNQLAGTISVTPSSNIVSGTNTRFRDQLKAGDKIVIKGMTHVVSNVDSQTTMYVTPDYRGAVTVTGGKACVVTEKRVPQNQFNRDTLDGRGPSGYNLDITKMQMIGLQWSWYGAGFIDFMLRGSDGNYVFAHRMRNSNVNTEAYMRTGNMPVRYEVHNEGPVNRLSADITANATTIPLVDASEFPTSGGYVYIDNELIAYDSVSGNNLLNCTRSATMTLFAAGASRAFTAGQATTHSQYTGVILINNTITPLISHWGSAFLTDGRFDEDRGYLFNYAAQGISISTTKNTAFLIRLSPSVSNAIVGDLGERELLNRAQLLLQSIAISSDTGTGGIVIEGVLNPQNYPTDPASVTWTGLSSLAQGGQPSFAQVASGGSVNWNGGATTTTATATTLNTVTGTASVPNSSPFARSSGTNTFYVTKASWDSLGASAGFNIQDAKFQSNTTVVSVTANPSSVATTLSKLTGTAVVPNNSAFNVGAGNNFVYFTQASWVNLGAQVNTFVDSSDTSFPAGTYVTSISGPSSFSGINYYAVFFSANSTGNHFQNSSVIFTEGGTANAGATSLKFTQASWTALPVGTPVVTNTVNDTSKFGAGTQISAISGLQTFNGNGYYVVSFNSPSIATVLGGSAVTFSFTPYYAIVASKTTTSAIAANDTITFTPAIPPTLTSFLYFTKTSWESLVSSYSAAAGTSVSDAKFPAGTRIQSVSTLLTFSGTQYYTVTFSQTSTSAVSGGSTVTFVFGQPAYALPGETIFSFISNPGNTTSLELDSLKELTNTPIGGRGAYPNGPDVLAINVSKTTGASVTGNIIIRWGEAQA